MNEPLNKPKLTIYAPLLFVGVLLHVLFCAESPLIYISVSDPFISIVSSVAYSMPGIIISIIFLSPIVRYFHNSSLGKGFFKGFTLRPITIALYIGVMIRFYFFIEKFKG